MVIGVYGDIPPDIFSMVEKSFSSIRSSDYAPPDVPPEPPRQRSVKKVYPGSSPHIAGIYVGYPGISYLDTKTAAVFEVIDAMTSGIGYPGGWLHSKLRGERLVYVVHAFNVSGIDPGHFGIYAGCDPSNIEKALHVIQNEIGRLEKGDFSDKEVTEAQKLCVLSEKLSYETPGQIAMRENLDTLYGLGHDFHETYEQRISSVTRENIIETAKKYFKHRLTVVTAPDTDKGRK
jgi:zinc protease